MPKIIPMVLGIDDHNGWANFISVCMDRDMPRVIDNLWVSLLEEGIPNQPYHHETLDMDLQSAEALIARVKESAQKCALAELKRVVIDTNANFILRAIAIRKAPLSNLPSTVREAHASRSVMFSADGMLYHHAVTEAAEKLGIGICIYDREKIITQTAMAMHVDDDEFENMLATIGKKHGTAWRKEHRVACAGAILALCGKSSNSNRGPGSTL